MATLAQVRAEWVRLGGSAAFFDANVLTVSGGEAFIWLYFGAGRRF